MVNRNKAEFYQDTLLPFEVNMQMLMHAEGTAPTEAIGLLGLTERDKAVLFCLIRIVQVNGATRMMICGDLLKKLVEFDEVNCIISQK